MKSFIQHTLLLSIFLFTVGINSSFCQKRMLYSKPVNFDLTFATENLNEIRPIIGLQIQPTEGFWSHLSLFGGAKLYAGTHLQNDFNVQEKNLAVMGELRIYPFGGQQLGVNKKSPALRNRSKIGCIRNQGKLCKIIDTSPIRYLKGIYIAPGYQYEKIDFEYVPLPHLETTLEKFPYEIAMQGPTLRIGYQLRFSKLTAGVSYGWSVSEPQWKGPSDIFGEKLYTNSYPLRFRLEKNLRLEIGINF